jgi:hypothetical protein
VKSHVKTLERSCDLKIALTFIQLLISSQQKRILIRSWKDWKVLVNFGRLVMYLPTVSVLKFITSLFSGLGFKFVQKLSDHEHVVGCIRSFIQKRSNHAHALGKNKEPIQNSRATAQHWWQQSLLSRNTNHSSQSKFTESDSRLQTWILIQNLLPTLQITPKFGSHMWI